MDGQSPAIIYISFGLESKVFVPEVSRTKPRPQSKFKTYKNLHYTVAYARLYEANLLQMSYAVIFKIN